MKYDLTDLEQNWIQNVYRRLCEKLLIECRRVGDRIPDTPQNGRYRIDIEKDITLWINGFWGGMMWQMYHATGKECYRQSAEHIEERLDGAFAQFKGLHHDVGFMWLPTAVTDYRITGNERAKVRGLHAATLLAGRYNPRGRFIRAWDPHQRGGKLEACTGWIIVDCLMNLPLLFWATKVSGDPRFSAAAISHADTALSYIVRPDGSCNHIVELNPYNGELVKVQEGQGYSADSAWSRGQAWALYGFTVCAKYTGEARFLEAAQRIAAFFIASLERTGYVTVADFCAPEEPFLPDTSAGACAACGLLELAELVDYSEKKRYIENAVKIMMAIEQEYADWDLERDGLLYGARGAYHSKEPASGGSMIFGDYYFAEAILRLAEQDYSIW